MFHRLIVGILLICSILGAMLVLVLPGIGIAHAAPAKHCMTAHWNGHAWVCAKDPPHHLVASPSKVYQEDGLPVTFEVFGQSLEPRTTYEVISDLPFACTTVVLDGYFIGTAGLPVLEHVVVFNDDPAEPFPLVATPAPVFVFADLGGNADFSVTVDNCVKRIYTLHLVSLSAQATEFSTHEKITVP